MGRPRGRVLPVAIALGAAILGCSSTRRSREPSPQPVSDAAPARRAWTPHYTEEELRPIWARLLLMRDGMVYWVGSPTTNWRLYVEKRDSTGFVAGLPILEAGPIGRDDDWLVSFKAILARPSHYPRPVGTWIRPDPEYVIRLWGEGDTVTVTTASDFTWFRVQLVPGFGPYGHLEQDREEMRALIAAALHPPKR